MNQAQKEYLVKAEHAIFDLRNAKQKLQELWDRGEDIGIDLNDVISEDYPFGKSFDEIDVSTWYETSSDYIESLINE